VSLVYNVQLTILNLINLVLLF